MIVYKDEAYKIMGAAFKVYNGLGHAFLDLLSIVETTKKHNKSPYATIRALF